MKLFLISLLFLVATSVSAQETETVYVDPYNAKTWLVWEEEMVEPFSTYSQGTMHGVGYIHIAPVLRSKSGKYTVMPLIVHIILDGLITKQSVGVRSEGMTTEEYTEYMINYFLRDGKWVTNKQSGASEWVYNEPIEVPVSQYVLAPKRNPEDKGNIKYRFHVGR